MSSLVLVSGLMMSSKEITEVYNSVLKKEDSAKKEHSDVLKAIRNMLKELGEENPSQLSDSYKVVTRAILQGEETQEILLNKKLTLCLVSGWSATARMKMIERIEELEKAQTKITSIPQTYAEALLEAGRLAMALEISEKEKQKALEQAAYQDKALGTSQIRNGLKTKENKKLHAKLRGYSNEYASLTQYIAREKINAGKLDTRGIVKKLKTIIDHNELVLQTIEGDKFASNCFPLEFLDNNRENIEVMIEMLKQNISLSDFIFEA